MPRVMVNFKFTDDERALLTKGAKANDLSEADYLRVCMVMDRVMSGDALAIKIAGGALSRVVGQRVAAILGLDFKNAPVKA